MKLSFDAPDIGSSFWDLLRQRDPALLPPARSESGEQREGLPPVPHGTTVLALRYADGVVVAGDRQATEGYQVASRRIEKVFAADEHSAIAIAGAAGPCLDLVRLFQTELAHYEKIEGTGLSLEGKANKLAQMIRGNLPLAMQGLIVIPIFAGYDVRRGGGRIFRYDVVGGRYEDADYHATGSGGKDARASLKKLFRAGLTEAEAVRAAAEALYDAADEDVGTGGADFIRRIFPSMKLVTRAGIQDLAEERLADLCEAVVRTRTSD